MNLHESRDRSVFINVPFDSEYEPLYVALVAGLVGLGFIPRSVLEIPSVGKAVRLDRIIRCMRECRYSIHDLSRAGAERNSGFARFNMPFELGIAVAIELVDEDHLWVLLEERPYRLQRTLSDLNGFDPHVHRANQTGIVQALLNAFPRKGEHPNEEDLRSLVRDAVGIARSIKRGRRTLFDAASFRELVHGTRVLMVQTHVARWR